MSLSVTYNQVNFVGSFICPHSLGLRNKMRRPVLLSVALLLLVSAFCTPGTPQPTPSPPPVPPACPETSPLLVGPLRVEFSSHASLEETAKENPNLDPGGRFRPTDCLSSQKVAVIVPFRNREEHLKHWLRYLHPILQRQQLDYGVYVVHQHGDETFNRAKLMNVGFSEALKDYDYDCFVFSDVDLIPMDDRNIYGCFGQPRLLAAAVEKWNFRPPYPTIFGGVTSISKEQFLEVNGFPNNYWGWGGEDDDFYNRVVYKGMSVSRPNEEVGKCKNIPHGRDKGNKENPDRFVQIDRTRETMATDGISSLSYKVVKTTRGPLYTNVTVDVGKP